MARYARDFGSILLPLRFIVIAFFFFIPTGCGAVGAIAYKVVGPPPVQAQYVPAKRPMLVLVENYRNPDAVRVDAERLSRHLQRNLKARRIAPLVDVARLEELRLTPEYRSMKIPDVGRTLDAKQVLYVDLYTFTVRGTVGRDMLKGEAGLRLRVVDVESGQTRWPNDQPDGYPLVMETPWVRQGDGLTEALLREQMAQELALRATRLFHRWNPEDAEQSFAE